jgi:hypothetical protein
MRDGPEVNVSAQPPVDATDAAGDGHSPAVIAESMAESSVPPFDHGLADETGLEFSVEAGQAETQQLRTTVYIAFNGEDETDYTEGPARMVFASDGVKIACGSLLMTLSLSKSIQRAIIAERAFAKSQRVAARKREIYSEFRSVLDVEISNHKLRLLQKNGVDDENKRRSVEDELKNLELMLEENEFRQQETKNSLEYQGKVLREIQKQANAELEEAFVCAQLLEPEDGTPDTPIEDLDLQKEYQEFITPDTDSVVSVNTRVLDTSTDHKFVAESPMTDEQKREKALTEALFAAEQRMRTAQAAFDRREADRHAGYLANAEAAERGEETTDASPEEFDLRWLQKIQELTRELIEAESALSTAKAAAGEGGIDVPMDDQASGFLDDAADGYRMSMEQAMISSVPSPKIKDWMSGIPEVASPSFNEHAEEADEWEAEEVEMCDSVSMIAQDAGERRRIDKWRQVCQLP